MTKQDKTPMEAEAQGVMPVHRNVYTALTAAQSEMGPLVKGSNNPHFKSKYADLADLVLAVRGPFTRHGLTYFHKIIRGDGWQDMRTVLMHGESETSIECDVPLIVQKNDMQGFKSATTYGKRIGLESVSGVAPEDDDGQAAVIAAPQRQQAPRFDAQAAAKRIKGKLAQSATLHDLKDRWKQEGGTIAEVKAASLDLFSEIERVKNERRAAIEATDMPQNPRPSDDLNGDEIPY